jgi:hypothetical protein
MALDIHVAMHKMRLIELRVVRMVRSQRSGASIGASHNKRRRWRVVGIAMMQQFEVFQKAGKDNVDAALKSFGVASKGLQSIAVETADFSKKSFEHGAATLEKLVAVKTLDKAFEVQADYAKSTYEAAVAQATKMGELYTALAKDMFKPYEGIVAKVVPVAK